MNLVENNTTTPNLPSNTGETKSEPEVKGGKTRKIKVGSRRQVFNGTAERTSGGLRKEHLMKNGRGRIVSTKRHTNMKNRIKTD